MSAPVIPMSASVLRGLRALSDAARRGTWTHPAQDGDVRAARAWLGDVEAAMDGATREHRTRRDSEAREQRFGPVDDLEETVIVTPEDLHRMAPR